MKYYILATVLVLWGCLSCRAFEPDIPKGEVFVVYAVDTETDGFNYDKYRQRLNLNSFKRGNIIEQVMDPAWRDSIKDDFGGPLKISWFLMTFEGYRPAGYGINAVAEEFLDRFTDRARTCGDEIGWHYHHADWYNDSLKNRTAWNPITTFSGRTYNRFTDRQLAMNHLASFIYFNKIYPASFRAGWIWENTDFSNWLDSVIPFDYSHNWDSADQGTFMYHPGRENMLRPGNLSRTIVRSVSPTDTAYMRLMFELAASGEQVIVAFYTHNFGSTDLNNNAIKSLVVRNHKRFRAFSRSSGAPFRYCTASEAVMRVRGERPETGFVPSIEYNRADGVITIDYTPAMFGVPLLCLQTEDEEIVGTFMKWDSTGNKWTYTIPAEKVDSFVAAAVSKYGEGFVWEPHAK